MSIIFPPFLALLCLKTSRIFSIFWIFSWDSLSDKFYSSWFTSVLLPKSTIFDGIAFRCRETRKKKERNKKCLNESSIKIGLREGKKKKRLRKWIQIWRANILEKMLVRKIGWLDQADRNRIYFGCFFQIL